MGRNTTSPEQDFSSWSILRLEHLKSGLIKEGDGRDRQTIKAVGKILENKDRIQNEWNSMIHKDPSSLSEEQYDLLEALNKEKVESAILPFFQMTYILILNDLLRDQIDREDIRKISVIMLQHPQILTYINIKNISWLEKSIKRIRPLGDYSLENEKKAKEILLEEVDFEHRRKYGRVPNRI